MGKPGREKTREVQVGKVPLGSGYPVRIQSMASSPTRDTEACVQESIRIIRAGADYIRFTAQNTKEAENLADIKAQLRRRGYDTPVIADVHFNPAVAETAARIVEKVRINPGNFARIVPVAGLPDKKMQEIYREQIREQFVPLLTICKKYHTALRLGVNHGSLAKRILERYGDTPEGMVVSAMEYLHICKEENFHQVVLSMKSSNTRVMVRAYRLLASTMAGEGDLYPLHLGITEAGEGEDGRIKSAVGIGALLADGLGDTIRVSLTEPSENEIPVAQHLVKYFSRHKNVGNGSIPESFDPFDYHLFGDNPGIPGFSKVPVVVGTSRLPSGQDPQPDLIRQEEEDAFLTSPDERKIRFVEIPVREHDMERLQHMSGSKPEVVLVAEAGEKDTVREIRDFFFRLKDQGILIPVILKKTYHSATVEKFWIEAAADMGPVFLDGMGNGLWLEYAGDTTPATVVSAAFGILQAARVRTFKPEYISCPSCGRTLFDIQEVTARIKKRTAHLKGIKIAVMGCIVNGPGEMADADYGYVGSGKGRITLYKNREIVKKNIPADKAVDELIRLIRQDGNWVTKE